MGTKNRIINLCNKGIQSVIEIFNELNTQSQFKDILIKANKLNNRINGLKGMPTNSITTINLMKGKIYLIINEINIFLDFINRVFVGGSKKYTRHKSHKKSNKRKIKSKRKRKS